MKMMQHVWSQLQNHIHLRWNKSNVFVLLAVAFSAGVLLESVVHIEKPWLGIAMAFFVSIFGFAYAAKKSLSVVLVLAVLFVCSLGVYRMQASRHVSEFQSSIGTKQRFEGTVVSDIDIRTDKQLFQFQPVGYSQKILVTTTLFAAHAYGDRAVLEDTLEEAKNFEGFDYQKFLEKDNIYAVMRYPKILPLKSGQGNWVIEQLLKMKTVFIERIELALPEPERSLLLGILIGAKKTLPEEVLENFNITGTSHIVAVSGFNLSIIIAALAALAKYFGRRTSFWLSVVCVCGFVIIAGASASVLRAAIMGLLLLVSLNVGRLYRIIPALCFAALIMLLVNPKILYYDVGFQLSFMATLGIVLFVPLLQKITARIPDPLQLKTIILVTSSAILATAPLIVLHFERLSVIAPIANVLILPIIPLVMLVGFLSALPFVGLGFGFVSKGLLWYILFVTELLAHAPYASLELHISSGIFVMLSGLTALVYAFLVLLAKRGHAASTVRPPD